MVTNPTPCANACLTTSSFVVFLFNQRGYPDTYSLYNETWGLVGSNWINQTTGPIDSAAPLPCRYDAAITVDTTGFPLLFGGRSTSTTLNDTWLCDLSQSKWIKLNPTTAPRGRFKHQMTYISSLSTSVMFGGMNVNTYFNETWLWNGTNWSSVAPSPAPKGRSGHGLVASSSTAYLFGGENNGQCLNDTWSFNGTTWTLVNPTTVPSARYDIAATYDQNLGGMMIFGGKNDQGILPAETWFFNGTTWSKLNPTNSPSPRFGAQMTFDSTNSRTILVGGKTTGRVFNDVWSFNGTNWTQLA